MTIELHDALRNPMQLSATRILIRDNFGQPIAVYMEMGPNNILHATAKNKTQFEKLIRELGVHQTAVVTVAEERDREIVIGEDD